METQMQPANSRSFRDVLVCLSAGNNASARLDAAIALASQHGARLTGIDVSHPRIYDTDRATTAACLAETFAQRVREAGLTGVYHAASPDDAASWKVLYAHYTDLVVAPTTSEADARLVLRVVPEDLAINAGVPVLMIPDLWQNGPLGKRVVVSWNASREATRAVHDTLPILMRADEVTVFAFDARQNVLKEETELLLDHLAAHDVTAQPFTWPDNGQIDPVDALFSCLSEQGSDLIVAGGYGHSRWMERLIGGASHTLARTLTVPVVMSH